MRKAPHMAGNRGLIRIIILIVILLLVLSYYGFSLQSFVQSPTTQGNYSYSKQIVLNVWDNYLEAPATYLWNDIFIALIWDPAIQNLENMKNDQPTNIQTDAPTVPQPQTIPN